MASPQGLTPLAIVGSLLALAGLVDGHQLLGAFSTEASALLETRMHEDEVRAAAVIAELRREPLKPAR